MSARMFCYSCETQQEFSKDEIVQEFTLRGDVIAVDVPVWRCSVCDETLLQEPENDPIARAYVEFRQKYRLLSPERVRRIRVQWGMSQASMAALLGMSPATINRYESGALQERTHDELIRACDDRTHMVDLLDRNGSELTAVQLRKIRKAVDCGGYKPAPDWIRSLTWLTEVQEESSVKTGFRSFDFDAFAATVLSFCKRVQCVTETKLYKLLFYADFLHYQLHTQSITGLAYKKMPYGPVPSGYGTLGTQLESNQVVVVREQFFENGNVGKIYQLGDSAALYESEIPDSAMPVLDFVCDQLGTLTPSQISQKSHEESGWLETPDRELISYEHASRLKVRMFF